METLRQLTRIVASRKLLNKVNIFGRKDSVTYALYEGLRDGRFGSDEEAAGALYGAKNQRYRIVKMRLKQKLFEALLLLDVSTPEYSEFQVALYNCNKYLLCAKLLLTFGAQHAAAELVERTVKDAEKFHLNDVSAECYNIPRNHYGLIGNSRKFQECIDSARYYRRLAEHETRAKEYYQTVRLQFVRKISRPRNMEPPIDRFLAELDALRKEFTSFTLQLYYFRLSILYQQVRLDNRAIIALCNEVEFYLGKNPDFATNILQAEFLRYRVLSHTYLQEYEPARHYAQKCIAQTPEGSDNWFVLMEVCFILYMHSGQWEEATGVFNLVVQHRSFSVNPAPWLEKWKIFEAYLRYVEARRDPQETEKSPAEQPAAVRLNGKDSLFGGNFRIYKFLNEVPVYSRDKRGFNVAILIVHTLFLLENGDLDGLMDRSEALQRYARRYLGVNEHVRSNCFLRMLAIMTEQNFNYQATVESTRKYYKTLHNVQIRPDLSIENLEVIPFEQLWQYILARLRTLSGSVEAGTLSVRARL